MASPHPVGTLSRIYGRMGLQMVGSNMFFDVTGKEDQALIFGIKCPYCQSSRITSYNVCYTKLLRFSFRPMQEPLYDVRIIKDITPAGLNFVVLDNGVVACINEDEDLELFAAKRGHSGVKIISDPVIGTDMVLGTHQGKVAFWRGDRVYRFVITSYSIHYTKLYELTSSL